MIDSMTPIAVVGTGNVGCGIASRLHDSGYHVWFGSRGAAPVIEDSRAPKRLMADPKVVAEPEEPRVPEVPRLSIADAVRHAGVIFLAVPWEVAVETLSAVTLARNAIVVDCTNPVVFDDGPRLVALEAGSMAAQLAAALPDVRVVKAFNHFGFEVHAEPQLEHGPADALVAGDDAAAKADVITLARDMGFVGRDVGPLRNAALLESMAVLLLQIMATGGAGRDVAFRLERRAMLNA